MKIQLWGVRGSIACSDDATRRYGGNTSCAAVTLRNGHTVIFDAGTGIRSLAAALVQQAARTTCTIVLTHGHWDHIMGLPFFTPLYSPDWDITLCAPKNIAGVGLPALMHKLFDPACFPVCWDYLGSKPHIRPLRMGAPLVIHETRLTCWPASHGTGAAAYRLEDDAHSFFYSGDHEMGTTPADLRAPFYQAMRGADVALVDAQYSARDYTEKKGWGHSAMPQWPPVAEALGVRHLLLSHFDPSYSDARLDDMAETLYAQFPSMRARMRLACEGLEMDCDALAAEDGDAPQAPPCPNCDAAEEMMRFTDTSLIFNALLTRARALTHADAGTLYLLEDDQLVFAYAHNETLFTASQWARQQYLNARLPVNNSSIAGFVAQNSVTLNIPDVRKLPPDVPYAFNESFDKATGYRTVSMCVMPLRSLDDNLVGVLQLINSKKGMRVRPFTRHMQHMAEKLCHVGAQAIERGIMVRDMILRMLQTAALRDPTETGGHVMRVGAMVAELYHHWAEKRGVDMGDIHNHKARLRLASMLHDVGKVGISDNILKKPGKLEPEERACMERHSSMGARLFADSRFSMDALAREIALHHHDRWDGSGYTGDPDTPPRKGEDIPVGARLTAIADVFDALVSPRSYKEPWPVEKAAEALRKGAGTHFDPEMVEDFIEIQDTMVAIRDKYKG